MSDETRDRLLRIGPFSRSVGVSADRLRNWERRYGVPRPRRSDGGFRLYSADDAHQLRTMLEELRRGAAPAEAARIALGGSTEPSGPAAAPKLPTDGLAVRLREALEDYDERGAQGALDDAFGRLSVEAVLRDVILPCMREIGHRWAREEMTVGQEHFASRLVEARLLAVARGWENGGAQTAVLACPSGELHTIGLIAFGLALSRGGWRILYLGADTPVETLRDTDRRTAADVVVLASVEETRFAAVAEELRALGQETPLYLGGAGANPALAQAAAGHDLAGDPVSAALGFRDGGVRKALPAA
ncbi:MAG TPA: B12-binding domain-containing protein [Solirubrobacterales bacterium]|nr:B12-binding domain-containing protein [Solirubrobacterales bacterium]